MVDNLYFAQVLGEFLIKIDWYTFIISPGLGSLTTTKKSARIVSVQNTALSTKRMEMEGDAECALIHLACGDYPRRQGQVFLRYILPSHHCRTVNIVIDGRGYLFKGCQALLLNVDLIAV